MLCNGMLLNPIQGKPPGAGGPEDTAPLQRLAALADDPGAERLAEEASNLAADTQFQREGQIILQSAYLNYLMRGQRPAC